MRTFAAFTLWILFLACAGCGQKGPLVLPTKPKPMPRQPAAPAEPPASAADAASR